MMQLEDYSKDVLAAYIKRHMLWNKKELDRVKWELETDALIKQSEKINEQMIKCQLPEELKKYIGLMEKDRTIQKKLDKLLKI